MKQIDKVLKYLKENHGQITNYEAESIQVSSRVLRRMYANGQLDKIAPGVYINPIEFGDDLAALQYRLKKGVYCKSTALFLHEMIDRTPDTYEMIFPESYVYNYDRILEMPLKMYRQSEHLYEIGIEEVVTPGGHKVKAYNVERTLCDILRGRDRTDPETIKQAMNSYTQMNHKDLYKLVEYSKIFKVEAEIRNYMEVLL